MPKRAIIVAMLCAAALGLSSTTVSAAPAAPAGSVQPEPSEQASVDALARQLEALAAVPDEVFAQGDAAVQQYLDDHPPIEPRGFWQVTKCVGAILVAVGSAAFPAAKLLKIKALIKAKGAKKVAEGIISWAKGNKDKAVEQAGAGIASIGGELLGISGIRDNCG
ncbi:hypothetical protein [Spirillospora sp. CA-294931]|uniref:hypothetical protein n=1 Tax=Spirillospora sp. CA-294931 TaxID=3240042 RepID=UPI003D8C2DFF